LPGLCGAVFAPAVWLVAGVVAWGADLLRVVRRLLPGQIDMRNPPLVAASATLALTKSAPDPRHAELSVVSTSSGA